MKQAFLSVNFKFKNTKYSDILCLVQGSMFWVCKHLMYYPKRMSFLKLQFDFIELCQPTFSVFF